MVNYQNYKTNATIQDFLKKKTLIEDSARVHICFVFNKSSLNDFLSAILNQSSDFDLKLANLYNF